MFAADDLPVASRPEYWHDVLGQALAPLEPVGVPDRLVVGEAGACIHAFIEAQLGDPELSPGSIAVAHFISVRYLHRLFETQQATVADWIRQRRLERCRRDLLDPALRTEPVGAIAARWGLTSPAHFSRLFRTAYGAPPRAYRAEGAAPQRRDG